MAAADCSASPTCVIETNVERDWFISVCQDAICCSPFYPQGRKSHWAKLRHFSARALARVQPGNAKK